MDLTTWRRCWHQLATGSVRRSSAKRDGTHSQRMMQSLPSGGQRVETEANRGPRWDPSRTPKRPRENAKGCIETEEWSRSNPGEAQRRPEIRTYGEAEDKDGTLAACRGDPRTTRRGASGPKSDQGPTLEVRGAGQLGLAAGHCSGEGSVLVRTAKR